MTRLSLDIKVSRLCTMHLWSTMYGMGWKSRFRPTSSTVKGANNLRCPTKRLLDCSFLSLPLPVPTPSGPWQDITMDFTEMPESLGYNYILVVVDWFSKEVVFVPCTKEKTAYSTAELFRDHVLCQHGLPSTIVSNCELVFVSNFLGELYKLLGIKRKMSTAFYPQTDG